MRPISQRLRPAQLSLFHSRPAPMAVPDWRRLPTDVRLQAVSLLARLLRVQVGARLDGHHGEEVDDE